MASANDTAGMPAAGPGLGGLASVRGHAVAKAQLARALERGQLHHALLLVGPRGVGKATTARAIAAALHCSVARGRGCGRCSACQRIAANLHAGVEWVAPEAPGGKIKVELARELAARLQLAPFEGDAHVVVFDPAEALTEQATNALLKTLEEPRPGVHFLLIAQALDGILPTILSRCAIVRFGRLDDDEVAATLGDALVATPPPEPVPPSRQALAVRMADGSAGVAITLALDASLDAIHDLVRAAAAAASAGEAEIFGGDATPLGQAWSAATAGPTTGKPARERAAAQRLAELWLLDLRERIRGRAGLPELPAAAEDRAGLLRVTESLFAMQQRLDRNANAKLSLEQALLEIGATQRRSRADARA
ncbi:MAG: AAA family ATPase [Nannocystaceae bacterium]|nr:AAA family ATPase [Nannocystaceae bacterium]